MLFYFSDIIPLAIPAPKPRLKKSSAIKFAIMEWTKIAKINPRLLIYIL